MSKYLSEDDVNYLFWKDENGIDLDPSEVRLLELHLTEVKREHEREYGAPARLEKKGSGKYGVKASKPKTGRGKGAVKSSTGRGKGAVRSSAPKTGRGKGSVRSSAPPKTGRGKGAVKSSTGIKPGYGKGAYGSSKYRGMSIEEAKRAKEGKRATSRQIFGGAFSSQGRGKGGGRRKNPQPVQHHSVVGEDQGFSLIGF